MVRLRCNVRSKKHSEQQYYQYHKLNTQAQLRLVKDYYYTQPSLQLANLTSLCVCVFFLRKSGEKVQMMVLMSTLACRAVRCSMTRAKKNCFCSSQQARSCRLVCYPSPCMSMIRSDPFVSIKSIQIQSTEASQLATSRLLVLTN